MVRRRLGGLAGILNQTHNTKPKNESGGGYESVVVFFADYAVRAMFHKKTVARKDNNKRSRRTIEEKR